MTSNEDMTSLDNSINDSFNFKIISDHRPCSADELFSNGHIRRSFPVDYYFSPATALKQPESLDHACVCPLPPVLPPPLPPLVNERRQHHRTVSCCRKSSLGDFCRSVRKCLVRPFHCGVSVVDDMDTVSEFESRTSTDGGEAEAVSPADKWIEFDNPMYEAVHCKRSSLLDAINNRGTGACMQAEKVRKEEEASIDR